MEVSMFKLVIVCSFLLAGAFLNSKHSPTNAVCDRIVDRAVQFVSQSKATAVGLASDVQTEVSKKN
jgi:hypothetical protein